MTFERKAGPKIDACFTLRLLKKMFVLDYLVTNICYLIIFSIDNLWFWFAGTIIKVTPSIAA